MKQEGRHARLDKEHHLVQKKPSLQKEEDDYEDDFHDDEQFEDEPRYYRGRYRTLWTDTK